MKKLKSLLLIIITFFISCSESEELVQPDFISTGSYVGKYFPTQNWKYCSPEEVGLNSKLLIKAHDQVSDPTYKTDGYLIIKDGYIVAEYFFEDFGPNVKHLSYSIAKSFTSATVGIAIDKGIINSAQDPIVQYYSELNHDTVQPWKKQITIENLLTMTSGIQWSEDGVLDNDLYQISLIDDYVGYVLNKPVEMEPGTRWEYNSGESMLLSGIFNIETGNSMFDFAQTNLLQPIGITDLEWMEDQKEQTVAGWGIYATMYDFARFGYLFLNKDTWDGNQVISENWVTQSTKSFSSEIPYYGYLWWLPDENTLNQVNLPENMFMAVGAFGQYIIVIPSYNIVIVRVGSDLNWNSNEFIRLVLDAA